MVNYIISPVDYEDNNEDRAYDPMEFKTRQQAENFIADMGSRWCLYPNIEIYHKPNILKRLIRQLLGHEINALDFIIGYDEIGEYRKV